MSSVIYKILQIYGLNLKLKGTQDLLIISFKGKPGPLFPRKTEIWIRFYLQNESKIYLNM